MTGALRHRWTPPPMTLVELATAPLRPSVP